MPTLGNFNGRSLIANPGPQLARGAQLGGMMQQQQMQREEFDMKKKQIEAEQAKQAKLQELRADAFGLGPSQSSGMAPGQTPGIAEQGSAQPPTSAQAMAQLAVQFPEEFEASTKALGLNTQTQKDLAGDFGFKLENTPFDKRPALIQQRAAEIQSRGGNPSDTLELLTMDEEGQNTASRFAQVAALPADKRVELASGASTPAEILTFNEMSKGLSKDDLDKARRIDLGLDPRAVGSAGQTITTQGTAQEVAQTEGVLAKGKESGKLDAQLAYRPAIEKAVKLAQSEATARGETLTDLARSKAALPGLLETVGVLKELSTIATSTIGGKIWDSAVKQTGFGSTEGATASAKFAAIVNNQVLPLLKPTFGAAFTVEEGKALRATMGDVDMSPQQKIVVLDSFIEQKFRDIDTKQREIDAVKAKPPAQPEPESGRQGGVLQVDANGNKAFVFPDGSFEEVD